jgi:hypothetical protein
MPPAAAAGPALRQAAADENKEVRSQASRALEQTVR